MVSPRSQGKGGRRVPWRDGGKRKQKTAVWRKQAMHAVDDTSQLSGELAALTYACPYGQSAADGIYLLDQQLAHQSIRYHLELVESRPSAVFEITVPANCEASVSAIIAQLKKR